jgi:ribosome-binding protein aMBF1 (putative translation factor)
MPVCPDCKGAKHVYVFADGHTPDGVPFASNGYRDCSTCDGWGEITQDYADRIEVGRMMRDARVKAGVSLLEASKQMGCSPAELSRVERGRLPKD